MKCFCILLLVVSLSMSHHAYADSSRSLVPCTGNKAFITSVGVVSMVFGLGMVIAGSLLAKAIDCSTYKNIAPKPSNETIAYCSHFGGVYDDGGWKSIVGPLLIGFGAGAIIVAVIGFCAYNHHVLARAELSTEVDG